MLDDQFKRLVDSDRDDRPDLFAPQYPDLTHLGADLRANRLVRYLAINLAGGIVIEQIFFLPGLGRLIFQAISARDLIVVESVVMLLVALVIIVNFAVDLAYAAVDPRLRVRA